MAMIAHPPTPVILNSTFIAGGFTSFADINGGVWMKYLPTNEFAWSHVSPDVTDINAGSPTLQRSAIEGQTYRLQL